MPVSKWLIGVIFFPIKVLPKVQEAVSLINTIFQSASKTEFYLVFGQLDWYQITKHLLKRKTLEVLFRKSELNHTTKTKCRRQVIDNTEINFVSTWRGRWTRTVQCTCLWEATPVERPKCRQKMPRFPLLCAIERKIWTFFLVRSHRRDHRWIKSERITFNK